LVPKGNGTLLRLRRSGLLTTAGAPFAPEDHRKRWSHYLVRLEKAVRNPDRAPEEDIMNVMQERDTTTIRQTVTFNASPQDVYEMIMDSNKHESLSREKASISREVGGTFKAWGDHISGFNLALQRKLSRPGGPMTGGLITTRSPHSNYTKWMVARNCASLRLACRLTGSTAILVDGSKPIGNPCRNSSTRALLATEPEQQEQQPGNELIKEISEKGH
jgi:hypothetical protein